ncbi:uncharacterized protein HipHop [Drosophila tropicalis]|uniref:uncharacterized protein HipHop n=1 Tax=Drosophila tropicalis TaxID=46794 RepID=UPI0035ABFA6B
MDQPVQAKRYCGLGNHELTAPYTTIEDSSMFKFAKRLNVEMRPSTLICGNCLELLKKVYKTKVKNAVRHRNQRQKTSGNSISDVSSSQKAGTSSESSQSQSLMHAPGPESNVNMRKRRVDEEPSSTTTTTIDPRGHTASTSAAALALASLKAAAQQQQQQQHPPPTVAELMSQSSVTSTDDDEPLLSLNAVNGTRLPHIQPIPKRRQIQLTGPHLDIYLAGTTGG